MNRTARLVLALGAFATAALFIRQFGSSTTPLTSSWLDYSMRPRLSVGEWSLLQSEVLWAVPASLFAALGFSLVARDGLTALARKVDAADRRRTLAVLSVVALLLNLGLRLFIHRGADFTDDERLYWYQAQVLLEGSMVGPLPPVDRAFFYEFIARTASGDGQVGLFPVGQPLLLALSALLGWKWLLQWLSVGALVPLTYGVVAALWTDRRVALLAAVLVALSPWWQFAGASGHGSVPTAAFSAAAWWCALAFARSNSGVEGGAAMAFTSVVFLLRSFDGVVLAAGIGLWWLVHFARSKARPAPTLAFGLMVGLAIASVQLYANWRATGSALRPAYDLWMARDWPQGIVFGFGKGAWNFEQTPASASVKTLIAGTRVAQWLAGSLLLSAVALVALARREHRQAVAPMALWAIAFVLGYLLFVFPSVHDFGSVYHLPLLPLGAALLSAGLVTLQRFTRQALPVLVGAGLVAALTFVAFQLERVAFVADATLRPLEAAGAVQARTGQKLLVLWGSMQQPGKPSSWVFKAPPLSPRADEAVLWAWGARDTVEPLRRAFPDRLVVGLEWKGAGEVQLVPVP